MTRLKVAWFSSWHPDLDAALARLPELETCPHAIYRELMTTPGKDGKRTALVLEGETPVAVIILRRKHGLTWEPALQWLVPGPTFPARPGLSIAALRALGMTLDIAHWRVPDPLPVGRDVRRIETLPVHRLDFKADYQAYWRETDYFRKIRHMRNRFKALTWQVNPAGGSDWVVDNWYARWNPGREPDPSVADRKRIGPALEAHGIQKTICLFDGDTLVAGATNFVHGGDLVAGVIACQDDYFRRGANVRLIDTVLQYAAEAGYPTFDMGGGFEYKSKWAPVTGSRTTFVLSPELKWQTRLALGALRRLASTARRTQPVPAPAKD